MARWWQPGRTQGLEPFSPLRKYRPPNPSPGTSPDKLLEFFAFEKSLAQRIRDATSAERPKIYSDVYREYYERMAHAATGDSHKDRSNDLNVWHQIQFIKRFASDRGRAGTFVEFGAGDGAVALEVCRFFGRVCVIEAVDIPLASGTMPDNLEVLRAEGWDWEIQPASVDVFFSNQVVEHLHPDDVEVFAKLAWRTLKPDGVFLCLTPNWLTGPHDISKYFVDTPQGLHLKEWDNRQLVRLLLRAGFRRVVPYIGGHGRFLPSSARLIGLVEAVCERVDRTWRQNRLVRGLTGLRLAAFK